MEKQFVPYALALKLKGLEFDEPCFARYSHSQNSLIYPLTPFNHNLSSSFESAPLWQQAFDFFETKFKLSSSIQLKSGNHVGNNYEVVIINFADFISEETTFRKDGFKTPLEAKNYCLNALIQFCS